MGWVSNGAPACCDMAFRFGALARSSLALVTRCLAWQDFGFSKHGLSKERPSISGDKLFDRSKKGGPPITLCFW